MSLIEQLKEIASWQYCKSTDLFGSTEYEFGWKDNFHFYLSDYYKDSDYEGRYVLVIWKDNIMELCQGFTNDEKELLFDKIKSYIYVRGNIANTIQI